jgi:electron transfer flavoprotein-quinone oxidoreductase
LSWEGIVVVGDAARFGINTGLIIRGMDLAIVSGVAAARAIIAAKAPADVGRLYQDQLEDLRLLANQRAYQNFHGILDMPRIFRAYPNLANDAMRFLFSVDGKVPTPMLKGLLQAVKRNVNLGRMAVDCWKVFRHL